MRLDEVTPAAEVPSLERGAKIVDRDERTEIVLWTILVSSQLAGQDYWSVSAEFQAIRDTD